MWLVFERFYPRPASDQMIRIFVRNLRLMAMLVSESGIGADANTIILIRRQRDQVSRYFGDVSAQSDAVPFETGPLRAAHMAARDRIRRWQATLRSFYLMELPLLQFRLFGNRAGMSEAFQRIEHQFIEACSASLNRLADSLENQLDNKPYDASSHPGLQKLLDMYSADELRTLSAQEAGLLDLTMSLASLLDKLVEGVNSEPLFAV
jgi:multidrug resistance protein MdtO